MRPAPSAELFAAVRAAYGDDVVLEPVRHLGGSSSLNLLGRRGRRRCVLRVYRPYVSEARLDAVDRARRALAAHGVPSSELVPTRDGRLWFPFADRLVELETYVEHDAVMDSWERLHTGLPLLGRVHTALGEVDARAEGRTPLFANHIEPRDVRDGTDRGTRRMRSWSPTREELDLARAADELASLVAEAEEASPTVPRQLVHGDFWDDNVLFRGNRVVLVTDLDFKG